MHKRRKKFSIDIQWLKKLFEEFMKTISVCGYANISKESYLSLSRDHYNHEKEKPL